MCGMNNTYLGWVERGEANITISTLEKIADRLGVEAWELLVPHEGGDRS